jgi:hypothetical protein
MNPDPTEWPIRKCAYCGTEGRHRDHSGVPECQPCWDWRKLISGPARHWYILSLMFLSDVDPYDIRAFFPGSVGFTTEDIATLQRLLNQLYDKTEELAKAHKTDERWRAQAEDLFTRLRNPG